MVAIRNLYWTERIAAFIVGGLIWLARCVRSSARRRGGVRAARPKSVRLTGFSQNGCRVAESGSHRRHILRLCGFVDWVVGVGDPSNRGSAACDQWDGFAAGWRGGLMSNAGDTDKYSFRERSGIDRLQSAALGISPRSGRSLSRQEWDGAQRDGIRLDGQPLLLSRTEVRRRIYVQCSIFNVQSRLARTH